MKKKYAQCGLWARTMANPAPHNAGITTPEKLQWKNLRKKATLFMTNLATSRLTFATVSGLGYFFNPGQRGLRK